MQQEHICNAKRRSVRFHSLLQRKVSDLQQCCSVFASIILILTMQVNESSQTPRCANRRGKQTTYRFVALRRWKCTSYSARQPNAMSIGVATQRAARKSPLTECIEPRSRSPEGREVEVCLHWRAFRYPQGCHLTSSSKLAQRQAGRVAVE